MFWKGSCPKRIFLYKPLLPCNNYQISGQNKKKTLTEIQGFVKFAVFLPTGTEYRLTRWDCELWIKSVSVDIPCCLVHERGRDARQPLFLVSSVCAVNWRGRRVTICRKKPHGNRWRRPGGDLFVLGGLHNAYIAFTLRWLLLSALHFLSIHLNMRPAIYPDVLYGRPIPYAAVSQHEQIYSSNNADSSNVLTGDPRLLVPTIEQGRRTG